MNYVLRVCGSVQQLGVQRSLSTLKKLHFIDPLIPQIRYIRFGIVLESTQGPVGVSLPTEVGSPGQFSAGSSLGTEDSDDLQDEHDGYRLSASKHIEVSRCVKAPPSLLQCSPSLSHLQSCAQHRFRRTARLGSGP